MKNKLKKDLKFLKNIWYRLLTAVAMGLVPGIIAMQMTKYRDDREDNMNITWFISTAILFIGLYFYTVWLYGDEDENNN
jgi:heme/copper-type cytochrome/quinol oxidase subunit 2